MPDYIDFLNWDEVKRLHSLGFHFGISGHYAYPVVDVEQDFFLQDFVRAAKEFRAHEVYMEENFCYPDRAVTTESLEVLAKLNVRFALVNDQDIVQPKFQTEVPMLVSRVTMFEAATAERDTFASHIWQVREQIVGR